MTDLGHGGLLRDRTAPQRVSFLELFFDLVFVFAVTQLSTGLFQRVDWVGAYQTLLLLLAVFGAWVYTAWVTNWFDPGRTPVQLLMIGLMLASLVMTVAIPEAFGARGLMFVLGYLVIQLGRTVFVLIALRGHELQKNFLRVLVWLSVAAVFWLVGAFLDEPARVVLWTVAVLVELLAALFGYPTPRLGRTRTAEWTIAGEHLVERCQLFLIIALGESILITGLTYSAGPLDAGRTAAFVVSFIGAAALWWIYFHRSGSRAIAAVAGAADPGRVGRTVSYVYVLMLAGIIVTAVGDRVVIEHPGGATEPVWLVVILGGPALFLVGHALFVRVVFGRWGPSRLVALLVLAVLVPVLQFVSPLMVSIYATLVLVLLAAYDSLFGEPAHQADRQQRRPAPPVGPASARVPGVLDGEPSERSTSRREPGAR